MDQHKPIVRSPEDHEEFFTEERCHILELLNDSDDTSQSLARARVEPGVTTKWHRLIDTSEVYYILEGSGEMHLGEDIITQVKPGDIVRIPENCAQRIANVGVEDLVFLCFCKPAFGDHCYESLE